MALPSLRCGAGFFCLHLVAFTNVFPGSLSDGRANMHRRAQGHIRKRRLHELQQRGTSQQDQAKMTHVDIKPRIGLRIKLFNLTKYPGAASG